MYVSAKGPTPEPREAPKPVIPLIDNPFAPEIFATAFTGCANMNGVIGLTLETARCDHSHSPANLERVVVGRLVLPIPAAQQLVASLNAFLEQQGLSPSKAMAAGASFQ